MRLFTEQTTVQQSFWTDTDRSVLGGTPQSSPSPSVPMSATSNLIDPLDITMELCDPWDKDLQYALCVTHGYSVDDNDMPCPPPSAGIAGGPACSQHRVDGIGHGNSSCAFSTKLIMAATLPVSADALVTEADSHAISWFAFGSIAMGVVMVFPLFKAHSSLPLAKRINSQSMISLTNTGILAIMAMFEIECLTKLCEHESRYLYNTLVVSTVGIS